MRKIEPTCRVVMGPGISRAKRYEEVRSNKQYSDHKDAAD